MTISELKAYIAGQLEVPVNQVAKFLNSFNKLIDELSGQGNIPFWAADLTFNTDNSGAGATCRYADSSGTVRFWNTKVDNNINNPPPNSPESTENSYWKEASPSVAGSTIFKSKPAYISTTAALPSHILTTIGGVDGCLQASVNGVFPSIDGVSLSIGQSILVRHEDSDFTIRNRVYILTQKGSSVPLLAHKWELTPREDMRYTTAGYAHFGAVIFIEKGDRNGGKFFSFLPAKSVIDGGYAWAQIPHVWPVAFNGTTLEKGDVVKAGFVKVTSSDDVPIGIVTQTFVMGAYFLLQVSGQIAEDITVIGSPSPGSIIYVSTSGALTTTETDWIFGVYTSSGILVNIRRNFNIQKGAANGIASLDGAGKVPSSQLPSFVDDVLEYANLAAFPGTGESGKIYMAIDTNLTYRWSGSAYVVISSTPSDASETVKGIAELLNQSKAEAVATAGASSGADHTRVVSGRGLWWWWAKIKTLTQSVSNVWTFTQSPIAPTPTAADNSTKVSTTEYVDRAVGSAFQDTTTLAIYKESNFGTP